MHNKDYQNQGVEQIAKDQRSLVTMAPSDLRFFNEDWTITLASAPHLKFHRLHPTNTPLVTAWVELRTGFSKSAKVPESDIAAIANETKELTLDLRQRFNKAFTAHQALEVVVELGGQIVGGGAILQIEDEPPLANIGIRLLPEARGMGVGKALLQVLLRLSNELDVQIIEAGTMKDNTAMRALARSLGLEETDEVKEVPGRGIVAEVLFKNIPSEKWMGLDINVSFLGTLQPVPVEFQEGVEVKDDNKAKAEAKNS